MHCIFCFTQCIHSLSGLIWSLINLVYEYWKFKKKTRIPIIVQYRTRTTVSESYLLLQLTKPPETSCINLINVNPISWAEQNHPKSDLWAISSSHMRLRNVFFIGLIYVNTTVNYVNNSFLLSHLIFRFSVHTRDMTLFQFYYLISEGGFIIVRCPHEGSRCFSPRNCRQCWIRIS